MSKVYYYGMRLRPYGPGCQPKIGLINIRYSEPNCDLVQGKKYWSILTYDRPLTDDECRNYDLDRIEQNYYDDKEFRNGDNSNGQSIRSAVESV